MIVYILKNSINGKCYVGQTRLKLLTRIGHHKRGRKGSAISSAIQKYGWDAFEVEVLEECVDLDDMNMAERHWISVYDCMAPKGYNLQTGGSSRQIVHPDTKAKISASNMGHEISQETKDKIAASKRGSKRSPEAIEKGRLGNMGKKMTPEQIAKSVKNRRPLNEMERKRLALWRQENGLLNWSNVEEIREARLQGQTLKAIGNNYGISQGMVSMIVNNKRWVKAENNDFDSSGNRPQS